MMFIKPRNAGKSTIIPRLARMSRARHKVQGTLYSKYKSDEDLLVQVAQESDHPSVKKALQTLYELTRLTNGERYGDLQRTRDRIEQFDKNAKEAMIGPLRVPPGTSRRKYTVKQKVAIIALRLLTPLINSIRDDHRKKERALSDDDMPMSESSAGSAGP